jgi:MFS family permease
MFIGLAGMSITTEIWQLYLFYGFLVGLGASFGQYLTCTTIANDWFVKKRSLALGLVAAAGGLGGFVFPPLVTGLLSSMGWEIAWLILAAIQLVCSALIGGLLLIRNKPESMEQFPDGLSNTQGNDKGGEVKLSANTYHNTVDWRPSQAIQNRTIWLITILCAANFFAIGTLSAHQVAYLTDKGFSPIASAIAFSLISGMSIFGRLGFGMLGIKFRVRHLAIASLFIQLIALVILLTTQSLIFIYIYAALFGISYGALVVALPTYIGAYYGRSHYAQILGLIFPLTLIAEAAGPLMAGAIYDTTGTYIPAFISLVAFSGIGLLCAVFTQPPKLV